jgi:hypothetical protein
MAIAANPARAAQEADQLAFISRIVCIAIVRPVAISTIPLAFLSIPSTQLESELRILQEPSKELSKHCC